MPLQQGEAQRWQWGPVQGKGGTLQVQHWGLREGVGG